MKTPAGGRRRLTPGVVTQRGRQVTGGSSTWSSRATTLTQEARLANHTLGVASHSPDMVEGGRNAEVSVRNKKRSRKRRTAAVSGGGGGGGGPGRSAAGTGAPLTQQQIDEEADRREIKEYLCRLRHLVPSCPKDGRMSRLDLIQHVIDYIVQLQETLVRHPAGRIVNSTAAAAAYHETHNAAASTNSAAVTPAGDEVVLNRSANPNTPFVPLGNRAIPINSLLNSLRVSKWHSNSSPSSGGRERTRCQGHGHPSLVSNSNTVYKGGRYPVANRRTSSSVTPSSAPSSSSSSPTKSCRRPLGVLSSIKPTNNR
ncbi:uncharacterized protein LOC143041364 [Oratosquilla oratoria]|uniref:uncharacterized protein LOC143041364 n=1 Tax=Oratosquilla oratoria TaxID=337810 RepID=UPI003F758179